jgi:hypothetical protein
VLCARKNNAGCPLFDIKVAGPAQAWGLSERRPFRSNSPPLHVDRMLGLVDRQALASKLNHQPWHLPQWLHTRCPWPGPCLPLPRCRCRIGKPGGGPTQLKGSRGHSGDAQLQENGHPRKKKPLETPPPPFFSSPAFGFWKLIFKSPGLP